jgi:hypothetical protein
MFNHRGDPMAEGVLTPPLWRVVRDRECEQKYARDLPPLWMRADMYVMREFMTGNVTSVYSRINGPKRFFMAIVTRRTRRPLA